MSYNVSNCWIWHDGTDAIVGRDDARKEFLNVPTNSDEKFRIAAPLNASGRFKSECIGSALNYLFIPQDLMSTDYCAGFLSGWRCDDDSRTTAQFLFTNQTIWVWSRKPRYLIFTTIIILFGFFMGFHGLVFVYWSILASWRRTFYSNNVIAIPDSRLYNVSRMILYDAEWNEAIVKPKEFVGPCP